jgi:hypothetical protein
MISLNGQSGLLLLPSSGTAVNGRDELDGHGDNMHSSPTPSPSPCEKDDFEIAVVNAKDGANRKMTVTPEM